MLIYNEFIKMFNKKSTIFFIIFIFLLVLLNAFFNKLFLNYTNASEFISNLGNTYSIMNIFIIIFASSIISSEFSLGTIRLLCIRPCSRTSIILSKLVIAILFLFVLSLTLFLSCLLAAMLFLNLEGVLVSKIEWGGRNAIEMAIKTLLANGLLGLLYIAICFVISSISRSQVMSVSISLGLMFSAPILNIFNSYLIAKVSSIFNWSILNMFNVREIFINNENLPYRENSLTLSEMLIGESIYVIILITLACILFNSRKLYLHNTD